MEYSDDFIQLLILVLPIQIISVVVGVFLADGISSLLHFIRQHLDNQIHEDLREDWSPEEIRTGRQIPKRGK